MEPRKILLYQTASGKRPYEDWFNCLLDACARRKILSRLERLREGSFGDHKNIGLGVYELRIHSGPGYRIYFGLDQNTLVILISGGNKSSQQSDIQKAYGNWQDYLERKRK